MGSGGYTSVPNDLRIKYDAIAAVPIRLADGLR